MKDTLRNSVLAVAAIGGMLACPPAGAVETAVIQLPGQDTFDGGFLFLDGFGPPVGSTITNTVLDLTYVSDGVTPASELDIHFGVTANDTFLETVVTGADLGFTSGAGVFSAVYATSDLNGLATHFFAPTALVSINIGSINIPPAIDGVGYFVDSTLTFEYIPAPEPSSLGLLALGACGLRRRRQATRSGRSATV